MVDPSRCLLKNRKSKDEEKKYRGKRWGERVRDRMKRLTHVTKRNHMNTIQFHAMANE